MFKKMCLILSILCLFLSQSYSQDNKIVGLAHVIDGDTIRIGNNRLRFWGIDAFEKKQDCYNKDGIIYLCGVKATEYLERLIDNNIVSCDVVSDGGFKRLAVICHVSGLNLNNEMVLAGWALDYPKFSKGAYKNSEITAKSLNAGAHNGTFETPNEYRRN
jgi:endonuclease YncB( thermonuclease family)